MKWATPCAWGSICAVTIPNGSLPGLIQRVLAETGFPPTHLELEVTESILLDRDGAAEELLRRIQAMGVSIAFDDFGTGYASLTHLKRFPLDRLKIDRSFVHDLATDTESAAIVAAIGGLGKRLGLSIIAEGIEDANLVAPVLDMGCDEAQGYLFGKPMPADRIEQIPPSCWRTACERGRYGCVNRRGVLCAARWPSPQSSLRVMTDATGPKLFVLITSHGAPGS